MKKPGKYVFTSVILNLSIAAVILAIGFFIGSIFSPLPSSAAGSSVGFVDIEQLLDMHPAKQNMLENLSAYEQQELSKLDKYADKELTLEEKKESLELQVQIRDKIKAKRKDLIEPLYEDIITKAKDAGREIGVEVVLDGVVILYTAGRDRLRNRSLPQRPGAGSGKAGGCGLQPNDRSDDPDELICYCRHADRASDPCGHFKIPVGAICSQANRAGALYDQ